MESAAGSGLLNLPTELRLLVIEHALHHGPEPLLALVPLGFRDEVYEGPTCNMTVTLPAATLDALSHSCPDRGSRGRFWLPLTKGLGGASKQLRDEVEDVWGHKLVTAAVSRPRNAQRIADMPPTQTWLSFLVPRPQPLLKPVRRASFCFCIVGKWSPALQPGHYQYPLTPWLATLQTVFARRLTTLQSLIGARGTHKTALDFVLTHPPVVTVRFPPAWSGMDAPLLADLVATLMGKQLLAFRAAGAWPSDMVLVEPDSDDMGPRWRRLIDDCNEDDDDEDDAPQPFPELYNA